MPEKQKNKKLITKLKNKYRLIIYNDSSYEEVWSRQLSRLNVISIIGGISIIMTIAVILIIAYTPLREFIPGYPDGNMSKNILMNELKLDSIENEIRIRDQYFDNLKNIIEGNVPIDTTYQNAPSEIVKLDTSEFVKSKEDSLLRLQVDAEESYNLNPNYENNSKDDISNLKFFTPLKGVVTGKFNLIENHYGIDIVAAPKNVISATLGGTVIFSSWTLETGYVLQIQHNNNFVSVYKHLSQQIKKLGEVVKAGDAIAIIGNSGEYSSGPHLHFELWYKGQPVNPIDYMNF